MSTLQEFTTKLRWQNGRVFKFKNSYKLRDAFNWYRKHRPVDKKFVLTEGQYSCIISTINKKLVENFCKGVPIVFPYKMGELYLYKQDVSPRLSPEGKLIYNAPIDWGTTLKTWFENEAAMECKLLIKRDDREIFKVRYTKHTAVFKNQSYVGFRPQRSFKLMLKEAITKGKLDAFKRY